MKTLSLIFLALLSVACVQSKSEVKKTEDCTLNGQKVSCDLMRGVVEKKARKKESQHIESAIKIEGNIITYLESKNVGTNGCGLETVAGDKVTFIELPNNQLKMIDADKNEIIYDEIEDGLYRVDLSFEDGDYTIKMKMEENKVTMDLDCDYYPN